MPYNGSGVYVAPSLPGSWNPAVAGQSATPADWNTLLTDLSTALSAVLTLDGQSTVTQNIPFNGKKITGLGAGTAATDAANVGQLQGTASGVNDTGAADAYVIAPTPAIAAYAAYQTFQFKSAHTNTGASTLAVSGLAAKAIKHIDGTALLAGDIISGAIVTVTYDGTNFQLLSATGMRGTASTWTAAQAWTAAAQFGATTTMVAAAFNNAVRVDVASATTTDIGAAASNYVRVTGTTTITGLGTIASGVEREVLFAGILTLTHNATSLILPSGANITTAAGDTARFISEGSGNWRCVDYERASGAALSAALTSLTNSVAVDVPMNNTALFFTGPTVAQGTSGTWLAMGNITISGCTASATMNIKLWDGTTVIDSAQFLAAPAGTAQTTVHLSGRIVSPAGNIRISVQDTFGTTGSIQADLSGAGKDSTLTVVRIA